jgi:hypothetical protein
MLLAALVAVAGQAQDRTLTVVVYDYAGLSDTSMNEVESLSGVLLSRAGIRTQWVHYLGHQSGPRPALCDANLEAGSVLIRIMPAHTGQPNKLGDPLGSAVVGNSFASLYASETRKYADHTGLPASSLMAYAMTHEIGHLLLGENHAPSGIMRAVWGKAEYREMAQRWLCDTKARSNKMEDEWKHVSPSGQLVKFTYSELPDGKVFLTAQIAGHEVVCSVILSHPEYPFSREGVESHFEHGTDFGLRLRSK